MNIDRRITNGLAWAGVALVVGVPTADLLSAQFSPASAPAAAQVAFVEPAAPTPAPLSQRPTVARPAAQVAVVVPTQPVTPAKPATPTVPSTATATADAVDRYLQSGKPMPSYIAGSQPAAPIAVAATPRTPIITAPAAQPAAQPVAIDPIQVAAIPTPAKTAPVPMPLSMRPKFTPVVANVDPIVIVPDRVVAPLPPANVTANDLADWESGPLSEFLAARQQQAQTNESSANAYYDADGFFLDEGPNRRAPQPRYIGPDNNQTYFFPFSN